MKILLVTALAAILLTGIAVAVMGVKVWLVKGGKFPSGHTHDNPELRRRGIGCAHRPDSRP